MENFLDLRLSSCCYNQVLLETFLVFWVNLGPLFFELALNSSHDSPWQGPLSPKAIGLWSKPSGAKAFGVLQGRPDSPERPMPRCLALPCHCHARLLRLIRYDQCNPHVLFNSLLPTGVVLPHVYFYTCSTGLTSPFYPSLFIPNSLRFRKEI